MMKIQSVHIKNYRALEDVQVDFDSVTTFIGPNGVGKSSVLRALDWYFNGTNKTGSLSEDDCSFGNTDQKIEVGVTFSDLTEKDHAALGKYAPDEVTTFTAWKIHGIDGSEVFSANAKGFSDFTPIKEAKSVAEQKALYQALATTRPDLNLPKASTKNAINDAMTQWEAAHIDKLSDISETLQTSFFGFNSNGKMSNLFDYVLVTADLRASEESIDAKASIIARILERSVDRSAADEEIAKIVESTQKKQQEIYADKFGEQLQTLTDELNGVVARYSPDRSIKVEPAEFSLQPPRTSFDVSILDGETETTVDRQGHGFQRTLLISALQILARSSIAPGEGTICLAIEEPELFQHPIQEKTFARVLRELAEDPNRNVQVTYATHSPYFLEARHFDQVRRLSRESDTHAVTIHSATVSDVKARLDGIVKDNRINSQLDNCVTNQLAVAMFANKVLLVEGTTDIAVFYGIGDRDAIGSLEAAGISIIDAHGKDSIPLAHAILTLMGIPVYTLFDGDGGYESRARANGKSEAKITMEKNAHIASNHKILQYFHLPEEDFPAEQVTDEVACFRDTLEPFLACNWPEWAVELDRIQSAAGISSGKNETTYRRTAQYAKGLVPQMLQSILGKVIDK
jgi:predicted ATP-dependent endonuclease of OLD family